MNINRFMARGYLIFCFLFLVVYSVTYSSCSIFARNQEAISIESHQEKMAIADVTEHSEKEYPESTVEILMDGGFEERKDGGDKEAQMESSFPDYHYPIECAYLSCEVGTLCVVEIGGICTKPIPDYTEDGKCPPHTYIPCGMGNLCTPVNYYCDNIPKSCKGDINCSCITDMKRAGYNSNISCSRCDIYGAPVIKCYNP